MNAWAKWKMRPQTIWWRKALFQIHLWTGIGLGFYILLMSVTGSALIFRRELARWLVQEQRVLVGTGSRMNEAELKAAAARDYPGFEVTRVSLRKNPDQAAEVWLESPREKIQRLFNPYTGADLGDSVGRGYRFLIWLVDLHDNLLAAHAGRLLNAAGGIFTLLLAVTGAVIWWPGTESWRRSLSFRWKNRPKGMNWALHSAMGFWTFGFFLMWAVSGIYLSIPDQFNNAVDFLEPLQPGRGSQRAGDRILFWLAQAHFGRFAGIPVKILWTAIGLVPAALFVTGAILWWNRVLRPWLARPISPVPQPRRGAPGASESSFETRS
jgi:uncharacterized iron-regulated membrane protein